jgi:hypothetical protein
MVLTILAVIRISVEVDPTSKIGKARFGKCRLTITPPGEKNFQKKKIGGRGPTGPPSFTNKEMTLMTMSAMVAIHPIWLLWLVKC